jgi:serine/threonine protein kinase
MIDYRCLIVERMQGELLNMLPSLLPSLRAANITLKHIDFGPVAVQLINIVEAIHQTKHILLDVKPENLMVNYKLEIPKTKSKTKTITTEGLAQSIRLVDFGLIKSIVGTNGKHVENVDTSEVQGTPLYCSLHVHNFQTPSRRDDVYAMLLVLGVVILQADGILNHKNPPYGTGTNMASYLPWSQEGNDDAIGKVKTEQMKTIKSSYFTSMPTKDISEALFNALTQINNTNFAQVPDYNSVRTLLSKVMIPLSVSSATTAHVNHKRSIHERSDHVTVEASSSLRRSTRRTNQDQVFEPSPAKLNKANTGTGTGNAQYTIVDVLSDSDVSMYDAQQGDDEDFDVEMTDCDPGNHKPAAVATTSLTSAKGPALKFNIGGGEGSKLNQSVVLDESNSIVIGSSSTKATVELPSLSPIHVRLTLSKSIPNAIQVQPLGKLSLVQVNGMKVPASGTVAFIGQVISFGPYTIRNIQPHVVNEYIPPPSNIVSAKRTDRQRNTMANIQVEQTTSFVSDEQQPSHTKPTAPYLTLKVTKPSLLKATTYVLEQGVCDKYMIGSGPSQIDANNEKQKSINIDQSISQMDAKHATVALIVRKDGTKMIEVHDLKSSSGTFISNKLIPSGKKQMAFSNQTIRMGNVEFVVVNSN